MVSKRSVIQILFHIVCWMLVAFATIMPLPQHSNQDTGTYLLHLCFPLLMCILFYMNYLWLVPRYFINNRYRVFICVNIITVIIFTIAMQGLMQVLFMREAMLDPLRPPRIHNEDDIFSKIAMLFTITGKHVLPLFLTAVVAVLLRLAQRWQQAENGRKEMEIQKTEAELKNLRNQINPHFLLNTLNNIYALISFDHEKAQKAVLSLSALLRQMLYENKKAISMREETEFLNNYVNLMRLRVGKNVRIEVKFTLPQQKDVYIAPFIFISLVENAFKHGVSNSQPSYISIDISTDGDKVICEIKNSNYPKSSSDQSGHGIGLEQVAKRLEASYKDKYEWSRGVDEKNNMYISKIILYDTQLRDTR
ncbi:MAG: sensor histidine kinase [Prevotella sp.]|nr:sensor histidine kinase [Prevotella sp.]